MLPRAGTAKKGHGLGGSVQARTPPGRERRSSRRPTHHRRPGPSEDGEVQAASTQQEGLGPPGSSEVSATEEDKPGTHAGSHHPDCTPSHRTL